MISIAIVEDEDSCARQLEEYMERYQAESGEVIETVRFCDGDEILEIPYSGGKSIGTEFVKAVQTVMA